MALFISFMITLMKLFKDEKCVVQSKNIKFRF